MRTLDLPAPLARRVPREMVRYGSLSFPKYAQRDVDATFAYLSRDAVERSLIERVEHSRTPHRIAIDRTDDDSYDPELHVIRWDPHSALVTTDGGRQSPALGLGHELDHAAAPRALGLRLASIGDPDYDSAEERRVITGSEAHAARTLHEALRYDHDGTSYRVPSPTMR
jgi:hypothetical protein